MASVSFREPEEADYCIQTLDGRWFGGRQITAQAWDWTTDYQVNPAAVKGAGTAALSATDLLWGLLNLFCIIHLVNNVFHWSIEKNLSLPSSSV